MKNTLLLLILFVSCGKHEVEDLNMTLSAIENKIETDLNNYDDLLEIAYDSGNELKFMKYQSINNNSIPNPVLVTISKNYFKEAYECIPDLYNEILSTIEFMSPMAVNDDEAAKITNYYNAFRVQYDDFKYFKSEVDECIRYLNSFN